MNTALDLLRKDKDLKLNTSLDDVSYLVTNNERASDNLHEEDLLKMIKQMPSGYQVVFNMFAIEGYSHKEIAEMLEISEGTSKWHLSEARKSLQQKIIIQELKMHG